MIVGLRIDVDTYRGTLEGVPRLLRTLERHGVRGTFYFSVGPDNMGRHLWRLRRPEFLRKMLRSRAPSLYGWDILLRGVLWPGPIIGRAASQPIREAARAGHEIGLHAWDHHAWQTRLETMSEADVEGWCRRGMDLLTQVAGRAPTCFAAPGWRCNPTALRVSSKLALDHQSDCRGREIFLPRVDGSVLHPPQIPTTLPTYDELIGRSGTTDDDYNERLLGLLRPNERNVLTIHAEVEGIARSGLFEDFLDRAAAGGVRFRPLGELLAGLETLPVCEVLRGSIPGREGWLAVQGATIGRRRIAPARTHRGRRP